MATFAPFVAGMGVRRSGPDVIGALPDPPRAPDEAISRPGVARHAGATVVWLPLVAQGGPTFPLSAPVTGTCRRVQLVPPLPELPGVATIIELSALPFTGAPVLRRLPGFPTFYLAPITMDPLPEDDELVGVGDAVVAAGAAFVGLLFDDRLALSPASWVEQIAVAMTGTDTAAEITAWRGLNRFDATDRTLRVLDHVGRPAAGEQIRVGNATLTTGGDGALPLPAGELQLTWQTGQPVHALYESSLADPAERDTSTRPGDSLTIPAALVGGHLQLLNAASWFADRPPQLDAELGHVRPDSRLEPLVDGIESFRVMLEDLRAADGADRGAHFAGWAFNDFPLDLADPDNSMFTDVVESLRAGEGARFLMDKYFVFRPDAPTDEINQLIVVLLTAGVDVLLVLSVLDKLDIDDRGYLALGALGVITGLLASQIGVGPLLEKLEDSLDGSKDLAEVLNEIQDGIALRARHPARFVDNALTVVNPLPLDPSDFTEGVGSWHQKFQVVRRAPDSLGNQVIGYVGGIDMNRNRLDSPGHHGRAWRPPDEVSNVPRRQVFHDVHARVTGPAAAEVARRFARRWEFDSGRQQPPPEGPTPHDVAFTTPAATDATAVPPQPARHLVQVGCSGYQPKAGGGSTPLPWSPLGEGTIPQAVIRAIEQAQEYIYIEDQYFTPPDAYIHALLDASVRDPKLRLLIVIPTSSDQLFGDIRRREMFERLRDDPATGRGWGERMIVGALVRRPVLGDAGRVASKGRLMLQEPLGPMGGDVQVALGPRSRLPSDVPFWLWIEGERMLAAERRDDVAIDGVPSRNYLVRRSSGAEPLWGARTREHVKGAPVTLAQVTGIYVHTKAIMVDDVFVGVGSCNTNRRGFFHDGEITAFAVPEQLKASRENPALKLRTALWAEHLGMSPAMGRSLLADPIAAFELFRRPTVIGNRVSTFDALGVTPELGFPGESATVIKMFATLGLTIAEDLVPYIWNVFADPTTGTDPGPAVGPELGPTV